MAASGYTPIQLYYTTTPTNAPVEANLLEGELAINTADGKLYYKNSVTNTVTQLAGISGFSGVSGYSGISGFSGYSGSGVSGYSGSGISGYSGVSGFSGYSGISGYSGKSGYSGLGVSGYSGASGYSGVNGTIGVNGTSGYSGISGYSGGSGVSGFSGGSGASGLSGFSGFSGTNGTIGSNGASGYSGFSGGSGTSGYSGATGPTTYPSTGFAVSTGSAWGTSLPDPLQVTHGGTGLTAIAAGNIPFGNSSTAINVNSLLYWYNSATPTNPATVRLGIGVGSSPLATFHVKGGNSNNTIVDNDGSQYTTLSWYNNGTEKAQGYYDATNLLFVLGTDVAAPFIFKANAVEGMRLSSGGGVSIGTSTGAGANNLLVAGNASAANVTATTNVTSANFVTNGTTAFTMYQTGTKLYFKYGSTVIASLDSSGNFIALANVTAYGTP